MPRQKAVTPKRLLKAWIALELRAKMELELVSELESRIPLGKISEFIEGLMRAHFEHQRLDLAAYGLPAGYFIQGPPEMVAAVKASLETYHAKR